MEDEPTRTHTSRYRWADRGGCTFYCYLAGTERFLGRAYPSGDGTWECSAFGSIQTLTYSYRTLGEAQARVEAWAGLLLCQEVEDALGAYPLRSLAAQEAYRGLAREYKRG